MMAGETDLAVLLALMQPILNGEEYVFCTVEGQDESYFDLKPIGFFREAEGLTLILPCDRAQSAQLLCSSSFRRITLSVHSSLEAVGFLAAVTAKLAESEISVNPVSAYYHDHLFVPADRALEATELLRSLSRSAADQIDRG